MNERSDRAARLDPCDRPIVSAARTPEAKLLTKGATLEEEGLVQTVRS